MDEFDDLIAEFLEAVENGQIPDREKMVLEHPELEKELNAFFRNHDQLFEAMNSPAGEPAAPVGQPDEASRSPDSASPASHFTGPEVSASERMIGNYRILEEIDRGGMGIVFRAWDVNLNRGVALKMIRSGRMATDSDVQRFRAEAKAAARLDHPGIVPVHDVGTHEGHPYFSMAFIEGKNLDAYHRLRKLTVEEACSLIRDVALAIDHAHENGLVHRDLKPANILVDNSGRPRITDFGLAKSLETDDGLTGTGEILGTINYMSPEQAAARNDQVDRTTDIYSLGAILYFLCTGRPPFETDNPVDTLLRILDSEPTMANRLNHSVPNDVAVICMRCLEKEPANRYQTARELADEIERFLLGDPIEASRTGLVTRFRKWSRREPSLVGHLVGLGLIELTRATYYGIEILFFDGTISQYMRYTVIIASWAVACVLLQQLQNRLTRSEQLVKFAWAVTDISFLTVILLIAGEEIGPLYIAYPLVIVVSGFFYRVRLVAFTTIICLISFIVVFLAHSGETVHGHYGVVGIAAIIAIGYVMSLLVHRIRLLNRLFE